MAFALLCFEIFYDLSPFSATVLLISSILPDIDHSSSILGRIFKAVSFKVEERFTHRSITHSLLLFSMISLFAFPFDCLKIPIIFGYGSHLFLDMLNISGIKLLYPLNYNFTILGGPVSTGSIEDRLIAFSLISTLLVLKILKLI